MTLYNIAIGPQHYIKTCNSWCIACSVFVVDTFSRSPWKRFILLYEIILIGSKNPKWYLVWYRNKIADCVLAQGPLPVDVLDRMQRCKAAPETPYAPEAALAASLLAAMLRRPSSAQLLLQVWTLSARRWLPFDCRTLTTLRPSPVFPGKIWSKWLWCDNALVWSTARCL